MIYRQQAYPCASAPRRSIILKSYKDFFLFFSLYTALYPSVPIYQASLLGFLIASSAELRSYRILTAVARSSTTIL